MVLDGSRKKKVVFTTGLIRMPLHDYVFIKFVDQQPFSILRTNYSEILLIHSAKRECILYAETNKKCQGFFKQPIAKYNTHLLFPSHFIQKKATE